MKLKQSNIKGFFSYGFSSLLFLHADKKVVLTVCTGEIWRKSLWPEGPKIFGDQKICAGDQI